MTARDREVLDFIKGYAVREGMLPTMREIGVGVKLASINTVHLHIYNLEKEGLIEFRGKRYRVRGLRYEHD